MIIDEPSGIRRGKAAIRPYWSPALNGQPPIRFAQRQATHGMALYGDPD